MGLIQPPYKNLSQHIGRPYNKVYSRKSNFFYLLGPYTTPLPSAPDRVDQCSKKQEKGGRKSEVSPPKLNAAHLEHLCEHGVSAELTREGQACKASVVPDQHQGALL